MTENSCFPALTRQRPRHPASTERPRLAEVRYRAGITAYVDVLDAHREPHAAEQATRAHARRAAMEGFGWGG